MLRETLSQTDLLELPIFAFLVFLATFLFVVVRVLMRGKDDPRFVEMAALPLQDDALAGASKPHDSEQSR
ncbi:MAG: hypothetical protein IT385_01075 [Deltaproteobacteria bacterium]|nr:hypothetical protein [Deltaproteobacteria bacterium]